MSHSVKLFITEILLYIYLFLDVFSYSILVSNSLITALMDMKIEITFSKLATFTSPVTTKFKLTLPDLTLRDMIRLYFNLI